MESIREHRGQSGLSQACGRMPKTMFIERNQDTRVDNERQRIMIVEDNKAIARAMQFLLQREGYETRWCEDESVYGEIESWQPNLILMDLKMPNLDGAQATARIKDNPSTNAIPVIVVTADNVTQERFAQIRANELINKPFQVRRLLDSIRHWLGRSANGNGSTGNGAVSGDTKPLRGPALRGSNGARGASPAWG
jgi:CheY-like chemotaxis protein